MTDEETIKLNVFLFCFLADAMDKFEGITIDEIITRLIMIKKFDEGIEKWNKY